MLRQSGLRKKFSIVIPSYNHLEDCLKPCIESLLQATDLSQVEIIVVANGCTDGTRDFLIKHQDVVKHIWLDKPAGYTVATNLGIKHAQGDYIILLNNDLVIYHTGIKNHYIDILHQPFINSDDVGITGCAKNYHMETNRDFLLFFCVKTPDG